jgi:hypothetical protein
MLSAAHMMLSDNKLSADNMIFLENFTLAPEVFQRMMYSVRIEAMFYKYNHEVIFGHLFL